MIYGRDAIGRFVAKGTVIKNAQTYKIGQRFGSYMIAQVGPKMVCMIDMNYGNRWNEPIKVKNGAYRITQDEFDKISAGMFDI